MCGCSGGVLLSRSLVGAVPLALGGLASGFGMGPGVSLPRCGRRDGGGVVVLLGLAPRVCGGVGGLVLGCVVDAGLVRVFPWFPPFLCSPPFWVFPWVVPLWVALFVWGCPLGCPLCGVVLWVAVFVGGVGVCVGCVRVGRLVPVG